MDYKIQKARLADSKFIYLTRNDKLARKYSGNTNIIKYEKHLKWFKKKVVSKSDKFYIILKKIKKVTKFLMSGLINHIFFIKFQLE